MSVALLSFVSVGTGVPMVPRRRVGEEESESLHSRQDDTAYNEVPPTSHSRFTPSPKSKSRHQSHLRGKEARHMAPTRRRHLFPTWLGERVRAPVLTSCHARVHPCTKTRFLNSLTGSLLQEEGGAGKGEGRGREGNEGGNGEEEERGRETVYGVRECRASVAALRGRER